MRNPKETPKVGASKNDPKLVSLLNKNQTMIS